MTAKSRAQDFLTIASQFKLGHLITESFHPLTTQLSQIAKNDLNSALRILQQVDCLAIGEMENKSAHLWQMTVDIQNTIESGNKVFMCGCGATGRLSLVLETLHRQLYGQTNQVFSFMAGGDFALIKSVESFEDKVEFGERQLLELGFGEGDLLISATEGGETPFVIGATNLAANISRRSPYFLYCNPDELLLPIHRSREVLENERINKVNLTVGPMAISGSTRMQASTVLMLAIGICLLYKHTDKSNFESFYSNFLSRLTSFDYTSFQKLTAYEAKLYQEKILLNYISDPRLAISILTDTTERSPTFSLRAFENRLDQNSENSLSYLFVSGSQSSSIGWEKLLWRKPRALDWEELDGRISLEKIHGFDISLQGLKNRSDQIATENFFVEQHNGEVHFRCRDEKVQFNFGNDQLFTHLMVKMLLNAHSTLIMGLLDRYQGNVMTWVRSSNNKLIDRSARYVMQLLKEKGKYASYEQVVEYIFEESEKINENDPIVLKVLNRF